MQSQTLSMSCAHPSVLTVPVHAWCPTHKCSMLCLRTFCPSKRQTTYFGKSLPLGAALSQ